MNADQLTNFLRRAIQPLKDRVSLMVGRAVIAAIKDGEKVQQAQISVLAGESMEKIERFQEFGFTSNPPANTEAIVVCLGGNRDNMVIVATENRAKRLTGLASGESAQYNAFGQWSKMKADGTLHSKIKKLKIENDTDELIKVLDDLVKWLETAYVQTAMGPQQFMPADLATLAQIKTRLETFKV